MVLHAYLVFFFIEKHERGILTYFFHLNGYLIIIAHIEYDGPTRPNQTHPMILSLFSAIDQHQLNLTFTSASHCQANSIPQIIMCTNL